MRQMACHPDLVLRSKTNGNKFLGPDEAGEATICRLCSDVAEDAIKAKCHHVFDRECIKQYLSTFGEMIVSSYTLSVFSGSKSYLSLTVLYVISLSPSTSKLRRSNLKQMYLLLDKASWGDSILIHGGLPLRSKHS